MSSPSSDIPAIIELREELLELVKATPELANREENKNGVLNGCSRSVKALDLYDGNFLRRVRESLMSSEFKDHILIISALYGLVKLDECLKLYDLEIKDKLESKDKGKNSVYKFWRKITLCNIPRKYIKSNNIGTVWSLLPI